MNIIVTIKQVPETSNVKMDEKTGTMIRDGVESIINPLDLYAIETAIELKEQLGGKITVLSMGPALADKALREAVAMGCDEAILITGREFSGSDTWATSFALSEAIKKIGCFDLILAGERAVDGDTGQVGPGVASFLNLPLATNTSKIIKIDDCSIIAERLVEEGYEVLQLPLPALLTVVKEISNPRLPTLRGKMRAKNQHICKWSAEDIVVDSGKIGLQGSPTRVVMIESPKVTRSGILLKATEGESLDQAITALIQFMKSKDILA